MNADNFNVIFLGSNGSLIKRILGLISDSIVKTNPDRNQYAIQHSANINNGLINLWDASIYKSTDPKYQKACREANFAAFVFDVSNRKSFIDLIKIKESYSRNGNSDSSLLIASKIELDSGGDVSDIEIMEYSRKNQMKSFAISPLKGEGINQLKEYIILSVKSGIRLPPLAQAYYNNIIRPNAANRKSANLRSSLEFNHHLSIQSKNEQSKTSSFSEYSDSNGSYSLSNSLQKDNQELQKRIDDLEYLLEIQKQNINKLKHDNEQKNTLLSYKEMKIQSMLKEKETTTQYNETTIKENKELKEEIHQKETEIYKLSVKIEELEYNLEEADEYNVQLDKLLKRKTQDYAILESYNKNLLNQIKTLMNANKALKVTRDQNLEPLNRKIRDLTREIENKNRDNEFLTQKLGRQRLQFESLLRRYDSQSDAINEWSQAYDYIKKRNTYLELTITEQLESSQLDQSMISEFIINPSKYKQIEDLGNGALSEVILVQDEITGKECAMKVYNEMNEDIGKKFIRECEIACVLSHPCVIKFYGFCFQTPDYPSSLIFEFAEGGTLQTVINTQPNEWNHTRKAICILEIVLGMKYLHSLGIIHRNLKPSNIICSERLHFKISDFSDSTFYDNSCQLTKGIGSMMYMSPEVLSGQNYTEKTDVYSFGTILYYLLSGELPRVNIPDLVAGRRPMIPDQINEYGNSLITSCWAHKSDDRPSFEDILESLVHHNFEVFQDVETLYLFDRMSQINNS